jgi:hypothetical protein
MQSKAHELDRFREIGGAGRGIACFVRRTTNDHPMKIVVIDNQNAWRRRCRLLGFRCCQMSSALIPYPRLS